MLLRRRATAAACGLAPGCAGGCQRDQIPQSEVLSGVPGGGGALQGGQLDPINLLVEESFHRAAPGGNGAVKAAGNYSPVSLLQPRPLSPPSGWKARTITLRESSTSRRGSVPQMQLTAGNSTAGRLLFCISNVGTVRERWL